MYSADERLTLRGTFEYDMDGWGLTVLPAGATNLSEDFLLLSDGTQIMVHHIYQQYQLAITAVITTIGGFNIHHYDIRIRALVRYIDQSLVEQFSRAASHDGNSVPMLNASRRGSVDSCRQPSGLQTLLMI